MPKILCMTGIVIAVLLLLVFVVDLVAPASIAPFDNYSMVTDIVFIICAGILGFLSWSTLREQD